MNLPGFNFDSFRFKVGPVLARAAALATTYYVQSEKGWLGTRMDASPPPTLVTFQPDTCRTPARHFLPQKCLTRPEVGVTMAEYF